MPIDIYQIKNLFWDNNSYEVPNRIPTIFEDQKEGYEATPSMPDYYGGTIKLTGGHWNWARYADNWYFLRKIKPLQKHKDIKKQKWLYALVKCMWCNHVLKNEVLVKGDIACWNIDKDLRKHLNKCTWILEKPATIYRIPFKKRTKPVIKVEPLGTFPQQVITTKTWEAWVANIQKLRGFRYATEELYKWRKDIYIFAFLEPDKYANGWKQKVADLINKELLEIKTNESRRVINVDSPNANNRLINAIALSYATDGIGKIDQSKAIKKIDLSKCTDIVRVNFKDLKEANPIYPLDLKTGLFLKDDIEPKDNEWDKPWKLARHFYAPIGNRHNGDWYYSGEFRDSYSREGWRTSVRGQKIECNLNTRTTGYFYWLDRIDFLLSFWFYTSLSEFELNYKKHQPIPEAKSQFWVKPANAAVSSWYLNKEDKLRKQYGTSREVIKSHTGVKYFNWITKIVFTDYVHVSATAAPFGQGVATFAHTQKDGYTPGWVDTKMTPTCQIGFYYSGQYYYRDDDAIWNKMPDKTPGYGVLMWQTERAWARWDRVEYTGDQEVRELFWYSGIKKREFIRRYSSSGYWWSNLEYAGTLSKLCKETLISKLFFDIDWFLWLYFSPRPYDNYLREPYYYDYLHGYIGKKDYYKILDESNKYAWYTFTVATSLPTRGGEIPPFDPDRYPGHASYRQRQFDKVFWKSRLDLKKDLGEDLTINKGDYFISSLEYEWRPWTTEIWQDNEDYWKGAVDGFDKRALNTLEDFCSLEFPFSIKHPNTNFKEVVRELKNKGKAIAVCSNYQGGIEIREVKQGSYEHRLTHSSNQAVISVDGSTAKQIDYWLLKKTDFNIGILTPGDTNLDNKIKFLTSFYTSLGHKVTNVPKGSNVIPYWDWLENKDINDPNGNLFDLVGTEWYVFLREGKAHFIYKNTNNPNPEVVGPVETEPLSIDKDWIPDQLKTSSLTAKINQINIIYFKTHAAHIKTRFLFSKEVDQDETDLAVTYKGINVGDHETTEEHYIFSIKGDWDGFEGIIHIPKMPAGKRAIGDQIQLEELRLHQNRERETYELQQQRLGLEQKLISIAAERQEWDLSMESINKAVSLGFSSAGMLGNLAMRGSNMVTKGLRAQLKGMDLEEGSAAAAKAAPLLSTALRQQKKLRKGIRFLGATGHEGISDTIENFVDNALWYQYQQPERARRIAEDKEIALEKMTIRSMEMSRAHFASMQDHALRINNLSNQYFKEGVTDALLFEQWRKEKLKRKKGQNQEETHDGDLYLLTLVPSDKQLDYLEEHRNQFGIHCDIPNQIISFTNGMLPNIIQLRNVDEAGIDGITELEARAWLKAKLLNKIKIVDNEDPVVQYDFLERKAFVPIVLYSDEDKAKIGDLEEVNKQIQEKLTREEQEAVKRLSELATAKVQLDEQAREQEKLEQQKKELEEKIAEKTKDLEAKIKELEESKRQIVITQGELEKEKKAVQHNAALVSSLNNQITEKDKAIEAKETVIKDLRKSISLTEEDKERINRELAVRAANLQRIVDSWKDTIATVKEEFPEATDYVWDDSLDNIAQVDTVKNILSTEIQQLKKQKQAYERNISNLQAKEKELEGKLAVGTETTTQKQAEVDTLTAENTELKAKNSALTTKLAEAIVEAAQSTGAKPDPNKPIQNWSLIDLMEFWKENKWSNNELLKKIIDDEWYGLQDSERWRYWPCLNYLIIWIKRIRGYTEDGRTFLLDFEAHKTQGKTSLNTCAELAKEQILGTFFRVVFERSLTNERVRNFKEKINNFIKLGRSGFLSGFWSMNDTIQLYPNAKTNDKNIYGFGTTFKDLKNTWVSAWENVQGYINYWMYRYGWDERDFKYDKVYYSDLYKDFRDKYGTVTICYCVRKLFEKWDLKAGFNSHKWDLNLYFPEEFLEYKYKAETKSFTDEFLTFSWIIIFITQVMLLEESTENTISMIKNLTTKNTSQLLSVLRISAILSVRNYSIFSSIKIPNKPKSQKKEKIYKFLVENDDSALDDLF